MLITAFTIRQTVITLFMQRGDPQQLCLEGISPPVQGGGCCLRFTQTSAHAVSHIHHSSSGVLEGKGLLLIPHWDAFSDEKEDEGLYQENERKQQNKETQRSKLAWTKKKRKKPSKQHFKLNICCHTVTGTITYFPFASYRLVGYWWKNDGWYIIFFSLPVWGKHYLLIHSIAASQFEENKHCGFWRQHHFYFMTVLRQLYSPTEVNFQLRDTWWEEAHVLPSSTCTSQYCVLKKLHWYHWKREFYFNYVRYRSTNT